MNKSTFFVLILLLLPQVFFSQMADKTEGCIPLTVVFSAPASATYFWDFGDGTSSDKAAPEHIFTKAGSYIIKLYKDDTASALLGSVNISVYPDLIVDISSDATTGCKPSTINFQALITKSSEVNVTGYLWTFGDGASATSSAPSYEYTELGVYDVSLEIRTNFSECDKTIIKNEYITIDEHEANFKVDKTSSCNIPETFLVTNLSEDLPGYTYEWQVGSAVYSGYDIGEIIIDEEGSHTIRLTMTAPGGCEDIKQRSVRLGQPVLDLVMEDTVCLELPIQLENNSTGRIHSWDFGADADPPTSSSRKPAVVYTTPGLKTVMYTSSLSNCSADTTFTILVSDNLAVFSLAYDSLCGDSLTITMAADNPVTGSYVWNNSMDTLGPVFHHVIPLPERDSFFVNERKDYVFSLEMISESGCKDSYSDTLSIQLPEAFFVPDSVIGLAPLTIGFRDESESSEPIIGWQWNFGDGTIVDEDQYVSHTFEEPGEYYVQSKVTTSSGCSDLSKGTVITVLGRIKDDDDDIDHEAYECEFGDSEYNYLDGSSALCVGQTLQYIAFADGSENVHVEADEGRLNHCWMNRTGAHTFLYPGTNPVELIYETKGFELGRDSIGVFRVEGARAEIGYEKFCEDSYTVDFYSNSLNEKSLKWWYKDKVINTDKAFSYAFPDVGVHEVILEAIPNEQVCNSHFDTAYIYVTAPLSEFMMDSLLCDNIAYQLDASSSTSSAESCSSHYHWEFEGQRPQSSQKDILEHTFLPGKQQVVLAVTDVNGCSDSSSYDIEVFGTEIDFPLDTSICLPHTTVFSKLTESDTTIISWEWSFGSAEADPSYTFTEADIRNDSLFVTLRTEDAIGCVDSLVKATRVYVPFSEIDIQNNGVCQGDVIKISADDFREEGRQLIYNWDFSSGGMSSSRQNEVTFAESGVQLISLVIQEAGTQCYDTLQANLEVLRRPQANFSTSVDGMATICYPHTVEFENTSVIDGETTYEWDFGNGSTSDLLNPAISYERGIFAATLTARSVWGCEDVKDISFELIGPQGDFSLDKDNICLGEEINLQLIDPVDVTSISWDLGDGLLVHELSSLSHAYAFKPPGEQTEIDLILRSGESGCEVIITKALNINEVIADFEVDEGYDHCKGLVGFANYSRGANNFVWDLGDGTQSQDQHPQHVYEQDERVMVTLIATDSNSQCQSVMTKEVEVTGENDFYDFANVFSPNGDGRNDLFRMVVPEKYEAVVTSTVFQIYDRWGQLVYDNEDPEGWDGTFRGSEMPADVYAYYLEVEIENCKTVSEKGSVTIVR